MLLEAGRFRVRSDSGKEYEIIEYWEILDPDQNQQPTRAGSVSKELRTRLEELYTLDRPEIVSEQVSVDGTRKWLIRTAPGIEPNTSASRHTIVRALVKSYRGSSGSPKASRLPSCTASRASGRY